MKDTRTLNQKTLDKVRQLKTLPQTAEVKLYIQELQQTIK